MTRTEVAQHDLEPDRVYGCGGCGGIGRFTNEGQQGSATNSKKARQIQINVFEL